MDIDNLVAVDVHTHVHRSVNAPKADLEQTGIRDAVKPGIFKDNAARLLGLARERPAAKTA